MYARHSQTHTYADTYERDKHTQKLAGPIAIF